MEISQTSVVSQLPFVSSEQFLKAFDQQCMRDLNIQQVDYREPFTHDKEKIYSICSCLQKEDPHRPCLSFLFQNRQENNIRIRRSNYIPYDPASSDWTSHSVCNTLGVYTQITKIHNIFLKRIKQGSAEVSIVVCEVPLNDQYSFCTFLSKPPRRYSKMQPLLYKTSFSVPQYTPLENACDSCNSSFEYKSDAHCEKLFIRNTLYEEVIEPTVIKMLQNMGFTCKLEEKQSLRKSSKRTNPDWTSYHTLIFTQCAPFSS